MTRPFPRFIRWSPSIFRRVAPLVLLLAGASVSSAQLAWNLTTADFRSATVVLKGISDQKLLLGLPGDEEAGIPLADFLDLERPALNVTAVPGFLLQLRGGDRLGGQPVAIAGQQLQWKSPILGQTTVPLRQLIAMTRGGKAFTEAQPKEDVVTLNNGDSLRGIVTDLNATQVVIQADAATTPLPLSSVTSVAFAASAGAGKSQAGYRVKFDDGESAVASSIAVSANTLQFSIGRDKPVQVELSRVVGIEQVNGPVSWLSSLTPVESIYTPYLGDRQTWPARMDESVSGEPLRFKEDLFSHGIGVHAYSRLTWALDGSFAAFRTRYAIEGEGSEGEHADVVVRIKLDGKTVYEQQHVRAGAISPVVIEKLDGAKQLTLEADFGSRIDTWARLNWLESALLRKMPAIATSAPATGPSDGN